MTHTPEELARRQAQEIANQLYPLGGKGDKAANSRNYVAYSAALLAIQSTKEECAKIAESVNIEIPGVAVGLADGASMARTQIATAIRAHLKGNPHDSI